MNLVLAWAFSEVAQQQFCLGLHRSADLGMPMGNISSHSHWRSAWRVGGMRRRLSAMPWIAAGLLVGIVAGLLASGRLAL